MKITFENNYDKQFVEILPSITVSWALGQPLIYIGWILWNITIKLNK